MIEEHAEESQQQVQRVVQEFGENSTETKAALQFLRLSRPLTTIAATLMEAGKGQQTTWRQADPEIAQELEQALRSDDSFSTRECELLLQLIDSADPNIAEKVNSAFAHKAYLDAAQGKPAFIFLLDDSYVDPDRGVGQPLSAFIPNVQLIFPLAEGRQEMIDSTRQLWQKVSQLHQRHGPQPPYIIGNAVLTAGADVLSPTIGQGLAGGGFELALNLLQRRQDSIESAARILGIPPKSLSPQALVEFFVAHEQSHNFDEDLPGEFARLLVELRCDVTAALAVLTDNQDSETELAAFISDLCVSFTETMEEEGGVFSGYRISSSVIMNELFESGVVQQKSSTSFALNLPALPDFLERLQEIQQTLLANNAYELAPLAQKTASPQARQFFQAFSKQLDRQ